MSEPKTPYELTLEFVEKKTEREKEKYYDGFKNSFCRWEDFLTRIQNMGKDDENSAYYLEKYFKMVQRIKQEGLENFFMDIIEREDLI